MVKRTTCYAERSEKTKPPAMCVCGWARVDDVTDDVTSGRWRQRRRHLAAAAATTCKQHRRGAFVPSATNDEDASDVVCQTSSNELKIRLKSKLFELEQWCSHGRRSRKDFTPEFGVGGTLRQIFPIRFRHIVTKMSFKIRQNPFSDPDPL